MPLKLTSDQFINKSKNLYHDKFSYDKTIYVNMRTELIITCKTHGDLLVSPNSHLQKFLLKINPCYYCSKSKLHIVDWLNEANEIHNNKYDYSNVNYINSTTKVEIICKDHGCFKQTPNKHINAKQGCPKCDKTHKKDFIYFVQKAKEIHGSKYDYSEVKYINSLTEIKIMCNIHGSFLQLPGNHIHNKHNCPKCSMINSFMTTDEFITKAVAKHGYKYDYSKAKYISCRKKVEIICRKHGSFLQNPRSHIDGANCQMCTGGISRKEILWLDELNIPIKNRNKTIKIKNKNYKVDAFIPETNTIYEFYGDYWHGNPKIYNPNFINKHNKQKFSELYSKTIERENELIRLGFNIISIWENELQSNTVITERVKSELGKVPPIKKKKSE